MPELLMSSSGSATALALVYGFVGGIILNVMPCVLPVLTMKIYDVMNNAAVDPKANRAHGLAYAAGIQAFYLPVGVVVGLTKAPANMMFQYPLVTAGLCTLMFVLALNAMGVFEITIGMSGQTDGQGLRASAFKGLVAAIMSIPCSAPVLGLGLSVAVAADTSTLGTVAIYLLIGLGLAFPFVLITFVPKAAKIIPKPGPWMESFKKLMGFTLMAAAVWLFGVLQAQIDRDGQQWFLYFLVLLALLLWAQGKLASFEHSARRRLLVRSAVAALTVGGGILVSGEFERPAKAEPVAVAQEGFKDAPVVVDGKIAWAPFDPEAVKASLARKRPVFMDYTADWCINCKANEKAFIEVERIRADLQKTNILPMKADFTNEDEVIEQWIKDLGRGGIPIYVIYLPDGTNILLPESITTEMLSEALHDASRRFPPDEFAPPAGKTASVAPSVDGKAL